MKKEKVTEIREELIRYLVDTNQSEKLIELYSNNKEALMYAKEYCLLKIIDLKERKSWLLGLLGLGLGIVIGWL